MFPLWTHPPSPDSNPIQNLLGTMPGDDPAEVPEFLDMPQIEAAAAPVLSTVMAEGRLTMEEYFQEPADARAYDSEWEWNGREWLMQGGGGNHVLHVLLPQL